MSHDAVRIVREHIEAFRHDDVPTALALRDTDVIVDTTRISGSFGAVSRGREGVVREVRRFMGAFDDYPFQVERIPDLGGGTVVVVVTERGHGKGSRISVERNGAGLYSILDGKIVPMTWFPTERDARAAVGLSEEPARGGERLGPSRSHPCRPTKGVC